MQEFFAYGEKLRRFGNGTEYHGYEKDCKGVGGCGGNFCSGLRCWCNVVFTQGKRQRDGVAGFRQTYLEDGNYEQAVASLEAILEIEPKQVESEGEKEILENNDEILSLLTEAYLGWIDDEVKQGNYDRAREILIEGREKTNNQRFNEVLAELHSQYGVPIIGDETELAGEWQIDYKKTKEMNEDVSIFSMYDFAIFGGVAVDSSMKFGDGNAMEYYVGEKNYIGGLGNYQMKEDRIEYFVNSYVDDNKEQGKLTVNVEECTIYIVKPCEMDSSYEIYWSKVNENDKLKSYYGEWKNVEAENVQEELSLDVKKNGMIVYLAARETYLGSYTQKDNNILQCNFWDGQIYDNSEAVYREGNAMFSLNLSLNDSGELVCKWLYEDLSTGKGILEASGEERIYDISDYISDIDELISRMNMRREKTEAYGVESYASTSEGFKISKYNENIWISNGYPDSLENIMFYGIKIGEEQNKSMERFKKLKRAYTYEPGDEYDINSGKTFFVEGETICAVYFYGEDNKIDGWELEINPENGVPDEVWDALY